MFGIFKKELPIFIVDTCFVLGDIMRLAQDYKKRRIRKKKWKRIEFKESIKRMPRIEEIAKRNVSLWFSTITEYEIRKKLQFSMGLTFSEANELCIGLINNPENPFAKYEIKDKIHLESNFINWALQHKLDLNDAIQIAFAKRMKWYFVTSEKKSEEWKKAYEGVINQNEFWAKIEKT